MQMDAIACMCIANQSKEEQKAYGVGKTASVMGGWSAGPDG